MLVMELWKVRLINILVMKIFSLLAFSIHTIFYAVILGVLIDRVSKGRSLIWLAVVSICAFGYYRYVILFDGGHFLTYHSWLFDPFYTFFQ